VLYHQICSEREGENRNCSQVKHTILSCVSVYDWYSKFLKDVKKLKTQVSDGEIMASVFWDSEEVIHVDFSVFHVIQQLMHSVTVTCFTVMCTKQFRKNDLGNCLRR
jgi:hypothetical protein